MEEREENKKQQKQKRKEDEKKEEDKKGALTGRRGLHWSRASTGCDTALLHPIFSHLQPRPVLQFFILGRQNKRQL